MPVALQRNIYSGDTQVDNKSIDLYPEGGGIMLLQNTDIYLQVHTLLQPRKPTINIFTSVRTSNLILIYANYKNLALCSYLFNVYCAQCFDPMSCTH
jgi:hypothetical protein